MWAIIIRLYFIPQGPCVVGCAVETSEGCYGDIIWQECHFRSSFAYSGWSATGDIGTCVISTEAENSIARRRAVSLIPLVLSSQFCCRGTSADVFINTLWLSAWQFFFPSRDGWVSASWLPYDQKSRTKFLDKLLLVSLDQILWRVWNRVQTLQGRCNNKIRLVQEGEWEEQPSWAMVEHLKASHEHKAAPLESNREEALLRTPP